MEPSYIIEGNIRRYQEILSDPGIRSETRDTVTQLLVEARENLQLAAAAEVKSPDRR